MKRDMKVCRAGCASGNHGSGGAKRKRTTDCTDLACELVDWRRFARPGQLMAYLRLVSREHSTGERERRSSITRPTIATAGTFWCRPPGHIATHPKSARHSRLGSWVSPHG
jgi:transposase